LLIMAGIKRFEARDPSVRCRGFPLA
jgi:hypothetical protein